MRTLEELGISPAPWKLNTKWKTDGRVNHLLVNDGEDDEVAKTWYAPNARLIAAAPDCLMSLCETLTALKNRLPSQPTVNELEIIDRAEAAIRKATGESEEGETK